MVKRTLPGLGLEAYFDLGENGWNDEFDENFRKLSFMADGRVISRTVALPGTGSAGDVYIVAAGQTNAEQIAIWDGPSGSEAWVYYPASEGWTFYVLDEGIEVEFSGSSWVEKLTSNGMVDNAYDLFVSFDSSPLSGQTIKSFLIPRNISFPLDFSGSLGRVENEPASVFDISVEQDGNEIGVISVSTSGVFSFTTVGSSQRDVAAGSLISLIAPTTTDPSISGLNLTLFAQTIETVSSGISGPGVFQRTISSVQIDENLTGFPVRVDLSKAPSTWWDEVARTDGGDIRVYSSTDNLVPMDLVEIDTIARTGVLFARTNLSATQDVSLKVVAENNPLSPLLPNNDPNGRYACWSQYAAVYLFKGDLEDRTQNQRTLTWDSGSPVYVSDSGYGAGGGIDMTSSAGYGSHDDVLLADQDFTMFGIAERTVEDSNNQTFVGMVDVLGANTDRQLLGQRDSTEGWTFFGTASSWREAGVTCALNAPASMGVRGESEGGDDSFFFFNGSNYLATGDNLSSDRTLLVGTGRGTTNSDWRGRVFVALFRVGTSGSNAWSKAEHLNMFESGGLLEISATQAWTGVAS